jgi:predicted dienelactone hydrolase
VNHHGNTSAEKARMPQGFLLFWERPKDLSVVLDKLLADPLVGPVIDRRRIGVAGFSLGGYTAIALGGAALNMKEFAAFCASPARDFTCEPQPEFPEAQARFEELKKSDPVVRESLRHSDRSYRDRRIRSVFAIAPALGSAFPIAELRRMSVPVHLVIGEADDVTPSKTNALRLATHIKGATLTVVPGQVTHYTFLAACTPAGKDVLPICRDAEGIDRAAVHREVSELAWRFFERTLGNQR